MIKKDRIALVLSTLIMGIGLFFGFDGTASGKEILYFCLLLPFLYWGYRFIKNDISFLKMKDE